MFFATGLSAGIIVCEMQATSKKMAFSSTGSEEIGKLLSSYLQNNGITDEGITASQLQTIYHNLRPGNSISLRQVSAAIEAICFCDLCLQEEVVDVLNEIDRRSFLMRDLEWEFEMLDRENQGTISEDEACFLLKAVHGKSAKKKCRDFLSSRAFPGSRVSLQEIEVRLCDSPDIELSDEDEQDLKTLNKN